MSELPSNWTIASLGEFCEIYQPKTIAKSKLIANGSYPVYGANGIIGKYDQFNHLDPQLLITCRGATCGSVNISAPKSWINGNAMVVRPHTKCVLLKFAEFFFRGFANYSNIISGSAQPQITRQRLSPLPFPIPPINEQKRIVAKLDSLTTRTRRAREELDRIPNLIEKYKRTILSAAFRGELTADWRLKNDYKSIHLVDGLPDGWQNKKLSEIADIQSGLALGKKRKPDQELFEIPYLRVANVQRGFLQLDEIKTLYASQKEIDKLLLKSGDILMNEGGDRDKLGRGWVWDAQIDPCIHQNHVFRVRLKVHSFPPKYISYFANEFGQDYFFDEGKQTTNLASISKTKLSAFPIPVPSPTEAQEVVSRIESALVWVDSLFFNIKKAEQLISRLDNEIFNQAFRGKLVPQDPNDEPASILLERIQAERAAQPKKKTTRRRKKAS